MLNVYFDYSHYNKTDRGQLFPLLKPFLKGEAYTDLERMETYGISEKNIQLVSDINQSDVAILTMSWNYYLSQDKMTMAEAFIDKTLKAGKAVWTASTGDIGYKLPHYEKVLVFRMSGLKSKLPSTHKGMPVFIDDPLKEQFNQSGILPIEYSKVPIVGFCGYADNDRKEVFKYTTKEFLKKVVSIFRKPPFETQPIFVAPLVRFKLLKIFIKADRIKSNFIFRNKYRAGANTEASRKQTTLEYFKNIRQSQYVLCIRGAGNFSVRFYETLAMGRIPVFVNTDCLVPMDDTIDWNKHVVWVEAHEKHQIAQKVIDFHASLNEAQFIALCESNRKLWRDELSLNGFFSLQQR